MRSLLSFTSIVMMCMLFASQALAVWGPNKSIIKKARNVSYAFVPFGLVAAMKKNGITMSTEEEKEYQALEKSINDALESAQKGLITEAELKEEIKKINSGMTEEQKTKFDELDTLVKEQQKHIDQLKTAGNPGGAVAPKSLKEQIKSELQKEENKKERNSMKSGPMGSKGFNIEIKAGDMTLAGTTAYTTAGTAIAIAQPEFIPGLNNVARNMPFIMQLLNVNGTTSENIIYSEKLNPTGSASWVAENAASGEVDFDIQLTNSRAKMVTAYISVATQMLDDIDYMASEIEKELIYQIAIKIDTWLLQGDGAANSIKGIKAFASAYVLAGATAVTTTSPNTIDCIMAMATQIAYDNFRPDIAVINTIDYNQTKLLKGSTGYYLINPNADGGKWGGITVVPSNQVPVGTVMVMDSSKTNVYRYQDFTLSYGWINDNFIKHMVSIQAQQRLHSFIKVNDANAFCYDTIANVKAAITAV
jgi:HK97 family phage major capsid protein